MSDTNSAVETVADFSADSSAGLEAPRRPRRRSKKDRPAAPTAAQRRAHAAERAERWAKVYTALAVCLSAGLNGYASVEASGAASPLGMVAAAGIGAVVPVLVWILGTVTAWTFRAGWKRLAYVSGAVAACVLALSVVHVAGALAALTGTGWLLAGLLAVGIDCGLVSSEATAILVSSVE
jgi:hypothetical protein